MYYIQYFLAIKCVNVFELGLPIQRCWPVPVGLLI